MIGGENCRTSIIAVTVHSGCERFRLRHAPNSGLVQCEVAYCTVGYIAPSGGEARCENTHGFTFWLGVWKVTYSSHLRLIIRFDYAKYHWEPIVFDCVTENMLSTKFLLSHQFY